MRCVRDESFLASADLAAEKGAFPLFERDPYLSGPNVSALPPRVRDRIARDGIRNGVLNSIAPAGSISVFANNVSSGVEPVFRADYVRHMRQSDGTFTRMHVTDYAVEQFRSLTGRQDGMPPALTDAAAVGVAEHVTMQAVVQSYTDGAVSKTVNVPEDLSYDKFEGIYLHAFDGGCKGCTAFRPNPVRGAILEEIKDPRPVATCNGDVRVSNCSRCD
jgi:ribonucleoside-diphosphate reductase alpha chain